MLESPSKKLRCAAFTALIENLRKERLDKPTPVQVLVWPTLTKGHDFVGVAKIGKDRTATEHRVDSCMLFHRVKVCESLL